MEEPGPGQPQRWLPRSHPTPNQALHRQPRLTALSPGAGDFKETPSVTYKWPRGSKCHASQ